MIDEGWKYIIAVGFGEKERRTKKKVNERRRIRKTFWRWDRVDIGSRASIEWSGHVCTLLLGRESYLRVTGPWRPRIQVPSQVRGRIPGVGISVGGATCRQNVSRPEMRSSPKTSIITLPRIPSRANHSICSSAIQGRRHAGATCEPLVFC